MILMNGLAMQKKDLEAAKFLTNMHPQPLEILPLPAVCGKVNKGVDCKKRHSD